MKHKLFIMPTGLCIKTHHSWKVEISLKLTLLQFIWSYAELVIPDYLDSNFYTSIWVDVTLLMLYELVLPKLSHLKVACNNIHITDLLWILLICVKCLKMSGTFKHYMNSHQCNLAISTMYLLLQFCYSFSFTCFDVIFWLMAASATAIKNLRLLLHVNVSLAPCAFLGQQ